MSAAMEALYAGDREAAFRLLRPDGELSVFEAAAFGREARLEELLRDDRSLATAFADDGFTALHLAVFGQQEGAARTRTHLRPLWKCCCRRLDSGDGVLRRSRGRNGRYRAVEWIAALERGAVACLSALPANKQGNRCHELFLQ